MNAAASKNLTVLLESVLADVTTDSPPGRHEADQLPVFSLLCISTHF